MKQLSIQIQTTSRNLAQTRKNVVRLVRKSNPDLVVWSDAGYTYANINLQTENPAFLWAALEQKLAPRNLKMIVTCQGNKGWDDYLMLHHFDKRHPRDRPHDDPIK